MHEVKPLAPREEGRTKVVSVTDNLGGPNLEGVAVTHRSLKPLYTETYGIGRGQFYNFKLAFSLRNKLRQPVTNINVLFVLYDDQGEPVHSGDEPFTMHGVTIPPRLARRINPVIGINKDFLDVIGCSEANPPDEKHLEIRIMDFRIVDDN